MEYLQSVPLAALEAAQAHLARARCLFDYALSPDACSPYAGMWEALRRKAPASDAAIARSWTLPQQ